MPKMENNLILISISISIMLLLVILAYFLLCGYLIPNHFLCISNGIGNIVSTIIASNFTFLILIAIEKWKMDEEKTNNVFANILKIISEYHASSYGNDIFFTQEIKERKAEELFWYLNYVGFLYIQNEIDKNKVEIFLNKYKKEISLILSPILKKKNDLQNLDIHVFIQGGIFDQPLLKK